MSANIKIYDENDVEITLAQGIDFGLTRVRYPQVKKIYLRNIGNNGATDLSISAETLNKKEDVTEKEYQNQLKAKGWKTFSLDNKNYVNFLDLGKISRGNYYEGIEHIKFDLSSSNSTLKKDWTNAIPTFLDNKLFFRKTTYDSEDKTQGTGSGRFIADVGNVRDIDLSFNMSYVGDSKTSYSAVANMLIPVRVGSDGFGYGLSIQRNRTNNKLFFAIYKKVKGMLDANTSILGTRIIDIKNYIDVDETKPLRLKVYNNDNGHPTFEFYCNGIQQRLYDAVDRNKSSLAFVDSADGYYSGRGSIFFDMALYKGDIEFSIYNIELTTENAKQPIYIKTFIENDAIDGYDYKTSLKLEWVEEQGGI